MVDQKLRRWKFSISNLKMKMVTNNIFTEDVILNHEGQEYAVLVHVQDEEHEGQDDTYMILARIETNDEGEEEYVPLDEDDENFEVLVNMYEAMGEEE